MSRTLLLEVKLVQVVLCKLSALGCAKAECPDLPGSLPQPALPAGQGPRRRGCWLPSTAVSRPGSSPCAWAAHPRGEVRQPNGKTSQPRLARRRHGEMLWPSVCSRSADPAQPRPSQRQAAPVLLLQSEMFTYSPAFLQQLESRLKYRNRDIICLLPAQDRLAPL